jgi:transcriptional regulator with AAA-type ATPase domain
MRESHEQLKRADRLSALGESAVYSALNLYPRPGNIRELENVIERPTPANTHGFDGEKIPAVAAED